MSPVAAFRPEELSLIDEQKAKLADLEAYRYYRDLVKGNTHKSLADELADVGHNMEDETY